MDRTNIQPPNLLTVNSLVRSLMDNDDLKGLCDAINNHGLFFKKAVIENLWNIEGVEIVDEEFPVRFIEDYPIDILAKVKGYSAFHWMSIECKRAFPKEKRWVFFEHHSKGEDLCFSFDITNKKPALLLNKGPSFAASKIAVCSDGIEISKKQSADHDSKFTANPNPIYEGAKQASRGALGFLSYRFDRIHQFPGSESHRLFSVLITTAKLYVSDFEISDIGIKSGNLESDLKLIEKKWLLYHFPVPTNEDDVRLKRYNGTEINPKVARQLLKNPVFVVNSENIFEFVKLLRKI